MGFLEWSMGMILKVPMSRMALFSLRVASTHFLLNSLSGAFMIAFADLGTHSLP